MSEFVVILDSPNSMDRKTVLVYLEDDNGDHRQVLRKDVGVNLDVDSYVGDNFTQLWNQADPLADAVWDAAFEKTQRDLYRDVVHAGVVAARGDLATLTGVTLAMETILLASPKGAAYTKLKTLATGATSVQRDAFFVVVAYLVLNDILAED